LGGEEKEGGGKGQEGLAARVISFVKSSVLTAPDGRGSENKKSLEVYAPD
jgi:hypothetical protein